MFASVGRSDQPQSTYTEREVFKFLHYFGTEALLMDVTQPLRELKRDPNIVFRSARHIVRGRQDDCNCWKGLACFLTPFLHERIWRRDCFSTASLR